MTSTCLIEYVTGEAWDDSDGQSVPTYGQRAIGVPQPVRCRVQMGDVQPSKPAAGDREWTVQDYSVHVPIAVVGVQEGDRVTIVTAPTDPDLPGRVFLVSGTTHKNDLTARRIPVQEVSS